ncbi:MAG: FAD-binding protein [Deltaproteobacteria bacterium]|nr:FAD-binding protein [Deltaproteobacteria bacterium]
MRLERGSSSPRRGAPNTAGSGRAGNDHFWCYVPEYHGPNPDEFLAECRLTQLGYMLAGMSPAVVRTWLEHSFEMVKRWEERGIPMKHDGEYHFSGHSFPGRVLTHLKYQGADQKRVLTKQARQRGAQILDRAMVFDLLGGPGGVTGALAVDTRADRFLVFHAKSVLLCPAGAIRIRTPCP